MGHPPLQEVSSKLKVSSHQVDGLPDSVDDDTFLLMLQTEHMNHAYSQHASKVLCVDSTHGTTQYRFSVVAAVVPDDSGEGKKERKTHHSSTGMTWG